MAGLKRSAFKKKETRIPDFEYFWLAFYPNLGIGHRDRILLMPRNQKGLRGAIQQETASSATAESKIEINGIAYCEFARGSEVSSGKSP